MSELSAKQRSVNRIGESFFSVTEWLIYGTIYQFVQISTNLSKCSRSLNNDYLLKYHKANFA